MNSTVWLRPKISARRTAAQPFKDTQHHTHPAALSVLSAVLISVSARR